MLSVATIVPTSFAGLASSTSIPVRMKAFDGLAYAADMPGIMPVDTPGGETGVFDPAGFTSQEGLTKEKLLFYREVELKHSRLAMLAAVGFPLAEQWHPLFGTDDAPSYLAFQQSPLEVFWPLVVMAIAVPEIYSVQTFSQLSEGGQPWSIRDDGRMPGDFGFDPAGLKSNPDFVLRESQDKELLTGRLAMLGVAGMIIQELVTGAKLF
jgi:hypothetical protein